MSAAPPYDTEATAESLNGDEEKGFSTNMRVPANMKAIFRRQFLQEMVKGFPEPVQNRITFLKNLQLEHLKLEAEFFEEVYKLEMKYHEKYQPLFEKRKTIITGQVEPEKVEPKWKPESAEDLPDFSSLLKYLQKMPADAKGIPNFWLTIFLNTKILSEMIQDHDEPVLQKLTDITIKYDDEHSYTLEFHFDKNEYFTNEVLTKQYFLKFRVDEDNPFDFEGPEIYKCKGCNINWEKKMNLTVKTIRKKQKHKQRGAVKTIVKEQVPNYSFFHFFNPPQYKKEIDEDSLGILAADFEIGHFLRALIIPKALVYYTVPVFEYKDDDYFDGEEEDDDEESGDGKEQKSNRKKPTPNDCPNQ